MIKSSDPVLSRSGIETVSERRGADTRRRLIASAEQLFAKSGVDAVSTRAVNAHAGVGPAAIHYHFGSKSRLLEAVIQARATHVLGPIRKGTAVLAARPTPPSARQLIEVLAAPYLHLIREDGRGGHSWVRLIAALEIGDDPRVRSVFDTVDTRLDAQVLRAFPDVPDETIRLRWRLAHRALVQMLSQAEPSLSPARRDPDREAYDEELLAFISGGLEAIRRESPPSEGDITRRVVGGRVDPSPVRLRATSIR